MAPRLRRAARALLVSPQAEVLLMRVAIPERRRVVWITPGGGLEQGEDLESGLLRELREEVGRRDLRIGPLVWTRLHRFRLGGREFAQDERYFLIPTPRFEPDTSGMPDDVEREFFQEFRWWPIERIERSRELFAPKRLGWLLRRLIEDGAPSAPFDVGV